MAGGRAGEMITPLYRGISVLGHGFGSPAFSPADISGLKLWLKADAGLYQDAAMTTPATANNDPVGGWADQSGLGNHATQAVSGSRGIYRPSSQNSKPGVEFTKASTQQLLTSLSMSNEPLTAIAVVRWLSADVYGAITGNAGATPYRKWWWGNDNGTIKMSSYKGDGSAYDALYNVGPTAMNATNAYIVGYRATSGGGITFWTNGSGATAEGNKPKTSTFNVTIVPSYQTGNLIIYELALYNTALSDSDYALCLAYLNDPARWAAY